MTFTQDKGYSDFGKHDLRRAVGLTLGHNADFFINVHCASIVVSVAFHSDLLKQMESK